MKIIGENNNEYILIATKQEVANLKEFYSYLSDGHKTKVGDEINVKEVYHKYRNLEILLQSSNFKSALDTLSSAVNTLTPIKELFDKTKNELKL